MEYKIDSDIIPKCYINSKKNLTFNLAVKEFARLFKDRNSVFLIGIGEDAALSSFFALRLRQEKVKDALFNDPSLVTCFSNDFGFDELFSKAIQFRATKNDFVIIFSRKRASDAIFNAILAARKINIPVITFSGIVAGNEISNAGDINFLVSSSDEFIVSVGFLAIMRRILVEYHAFYEIKDFNYERTYDKFNLFRND